MINESSTPSILCSYAVADQGLAPSWCAALVASDAGVQAVVVSNKTMLRACRLNPTATKCTVVPGLRYLSA